MPCVSAADRLRVALKAVNDARAKVLQCTYPRGMPTRGCTVRLPPKPQRELAKVMATGQPILSRKGKLNVPMATNGSTYKGQVVVKQAAARRKYEAELTANKAKGRAILESAALLNELRNVSRAIATPALLAKPQPVRAKLYTVLAPGVPAEHAAKVLGITLKPGVDNAAE